MPSEDETIAIMHNGRYIQIPNTIVTTDVNAWTSLEGSRAVTIDRLDKLETQIREIQSRLDSMCIDAEKLHALKEQVSLLELLKSDIENS